MLDLKISTTIMINAVKFLKIYSATSEFCMKKRMLYRIQTRSLRFLASLQWKCTLKNVRVLQKVQQKSNNPKT
jgi:hypothetical protein